MFYLFARKADVEEYLTGGYPDEMLYIQQKGFQTWECWFDELPDAAFQVWVGQGGGDPVPMLYSKLVSNEAEVLPEYYLKQYQKEGGSLDAWELRDSIFYTQYSSMAEASSALEQLSAFFAWTEDKPLAHLVAFAAYRIFYLGLVWVEYDMETVIFHYSHKEGYRFRWGEIPGDLSQFRTAEARR